MSNEPNIYPPDEKPDPEFERLVQEAKSGVHPSWDKGNVLLNCLCMIATVALCVALSTISLFLILFALGPLGGLMFCFGDSSANRQVGRRILLGCFLGFLYLVVITHVTQRSMVEETPER